jgi:topoisomerase-4 subunit B
MYIGKLGDGSSLDDGIYVLLKESIDNCIDEYVMGFGKKIEITIKDRMVRVRDYGRGIPLGKVVDVVSKINTGAKYDSVAFKKSVGLNGVGTKAVNALSSYFKVQSVRDGKMKVAEFEKGNLTNETDITDTNDSKGTLVQFLPDEAIFGNYKFISEYVEKMLWNYAYLNTGLSIHFNGQVFKSERGLYDLLEQNLSGEPLYPIIHLKGEDIEIAMTHGNQYSEEYYSFVNGQHTTQGGTHQASLREAVVKVVREFYKKDFDANDVRQSIIIAISVKVVEPVFESQTKTKLGSQIIAPDGPAIRTFVIDFLKKELDNYLHKHAEVAEALLHKIIQSEKERKDI